MARQALAVADVDDGKETYTSARQRDHFLSSDAIALVEGWIEVRMSRLLN